LSDIIVGINAMKNINIIFMTSSFIVEDGRMSVRSFPLFLCYQAVSAWIYVKSRISETDFEPFIVYLISGFTLDSFLKSTAYRHTWF